MRSLNYQVPAIPSVGTGAVWMWCGGACAVLLLAWLMVGACAVLLALRMVDGWCQRCPSHRPMPAFIAPGNASRVTP